MDKSLLPEITLDNWREWSSDLQSRPVLHGALNGGRSNRSFVLNSDIGKLVLRINGTGSLLPDADRANEINIWKAASKQGIAPPLVYTDHQSRYLISMHIHNDLPLKPPLDPAYVDQAFDLLNRCHQLDINAPVINYFDHINHYWQIIEAKNKTPNPALGDQRKPMQQLLESLLTSDTPTGICHHDPVIANFVGTPNRLYLIDWEYAASGLQIMDYAALATEWQIEDAIVLERTKFESESLIQAKALYWYLCNLWEAATT